MSQIAEPIEEYAARGREKARAPQFGWVAPLLFLAPAFGTLALWVYWPLIETFRLSFYEWNLLPTVDPVFVGWDNYRNLLALAEMRRVLRPGGRLLVLEFSKVAKPLQPVYDLYSFKVLPWLGEKIAGDAASYKYLAESIRMHPDQETLKGMMEQVGLERVEVFNLTAGVVALHRGYKF